MAFIPNENMYNNGDKVVLLKDINIASGTFTKGTEMYIIRYSGKYKKWDLTDNQGNKLLNCSVDNFEKRHPLDYILKNKLSEGQDYTKNYETQSEYFGRTWDK